MFTYTHVMKWAFWEMMRFLLLSKERSDGKKRIMHCYGHAWYVERSSMALGIIVTPTAYQAHKIHETKVDDVGHGIYMVLLYT